MKLKYNDIKYNKSIPNVYKRYLNYRFNNRFHFKTYDQTNSIQIFMNIYN